ncbi:FKBP-type peptidyl-prolyl cis-trans isomerase [Candidatus Saccharibacteria bacterium]|nr:FKBP-type peptidyl-prolyl cis-trans isomerase [Candidatus Saccharibacteria bacterium]
MKSVESKTPMGQRIAIGGIAALMVISTIALYLMIIISDGNDRSELARQEEAMARFVEMESVWSAEASALMEEQRVELSERYFEEFSRFRGEVRGFNAAAVTELSTRDLVIGGGREIGENDFDYAAFYIGFLADETIFDSSLNEASLANPLMGGSMIDGWNEGIVGMRIGGVREITIPAHMGYGPQEMGEIPPNSPLRFIVMMIERPADIDFPPFPEGIVEACIEAHRHELGDMAEFLCEDAYGNHGEF